MVMRKTGFQFVVVALSFLSQTYPDAWSGHQDSSQETGQNSQQERERTPIQSISSKKSEPQDESQSPKESKKPSRRCSTSSTNSEQDISVDEVVQKKRKEQMEKIFRLLEEVCAGKSVEQQVEYIASLMNTEQSEKKDTSLDGPLPKNGPLSKKAKKKKEKKQQPYKTPEKQLEDYLSDLFITEQDFLAQIRDFFSEGEKALQKKKFTLFKEELARTIESLLPSVFSDSGWKNHMKIANFASEDYIVTFVPGIGRGPVVGDPVVAANVSGLEGEEIEALLNDNFVLACFFAGKISDWVFQETSGRARSENEENLYEHEVGLRHEVVKRKFPQMIAELRKIIKEVATENALSSGPVEERISEVQELLKSLKGMFWDKLPAWARIKARLQDGMKVADPVFVNTTCLADPFLEKRWLDYSINSDDNVTDVDPEIANTLKDGDTITLMEKAYQTTVRKDETGVNMSQFPQQCLKMRVLLPGERPLADGGDSFLGSFYLMPKPGVPVEEGKTWTSADLSPQKSLCKKPYEHTVFFGGEGNNLCEKLYDSDPDIGAVMAEFLAPIDAPSVREEDLGLVLQLFLDKNTPIETEADGRMKGNDFGKWIREKTRNLFLNHFDMKMVSLGTDSVSFVSEGFDFPVSYTPTVSSVVGTYKAFFIPEPRLSERFDRDYDVDIQAPFFVQSKDNNPMTSQWDRSFYCPKTYIHLDVTKHDPDREGAPLKIGRIFVYANGNDAFHEEE